MHNLQYCNMAAGARFIFRSLARVSAQIRPMIRTKLSHGHGVVISSRKLTPGCNIDSKALCTSVQMTRTKFYSSSYPLGCKVSNSHPLAFICSASTSRDLDSLADDDEGDTW